ncbi:MAG: hypothetical protein A2V66_11430 [Ignavibacteria bacterium RBG_13_36_8]|nr:MAG: hypothetical protein A2V66_11430 [Ignavibacteria bacterium RBG_13_36_8]
MSLEQYKLTFIESSVKKLYDYGLEKTWFGEQLIFSILISSGGVKYSFLDPNKYIVYPDYDNIALKKELICLHYHAGNKNRILKNDNVRKLMQSYHRMI